MEIAEKAEENPFLKLQEIFKDKKGKHMLFSTICVVPTPTPRNSSILNSYLYDWKEVARNNSLAYSVFLKLL